jgi:Ca2+:H+ antiporter
MSSPEIEVDLSPTDTRDNFAEDTITQEDTQADITMADTMRDPVNPLREMQEALNKSHPFGIKIWKPALYKKHRGIDLVMESDLHRVPGSIKSTKSIGNFLWTMIFGWWIALGYILIALVILAPLWLLGVIGYRLCTLSDRYRFRPLTTFFQDLSAMNNYVQVMINLADYIFWPFGKFVAKRVLYDLNPQEEEPLLSNHDHDHAEAIPALSSPFLRPLSGDIQQASVSDLAYDETWSEENEKPNLFGTRGFLGLLANVWRSGVSGVVFFFLTAAILGPIHLSVSFVCFFLILPIPVGKLNYYLLRHLLLHPLQLTAHSCDYDPTLSQTLHPNGTVPHSVHPERNTRTRPRSIFFWRPETITGDSADDQTLLPTIMATPSLRPVPVANRTNNNREYQIILCMYRAMGVEYLKYTAFGVNIIFVNLLSMIVFTLADFYLLGPMNDYTGIAARPVIFLGGILSTIPLAYFIGMAVSSITAHTGSVAIGAVINATFGSIIEIILYAFGLMEGKEELVQGAMIGSFLLGLLALPGVAMFSGGLVRSAQRFNAKSATVTSTMLVVSVIGVFTPTIFQNIHGTYQFDCMDCPANNVLNKNHIVFSDGKSCRSCRIYQPHPTQDPIYQTMTRPLMYICTVVLLLTYAIGLYFTLGTHLDQIYPKKKPSKKRNLHVLIKEVPQRPKRLLSELPRPMSDPGGLLAVPQLAISGPSSSTDTHGNPKLMNVNSDRSLATPDDGSSSDEEEHGHENPGWSIFWSSMVLLGCTILYTLIAEVLIDCLDEIIDQFPISEKTLGLTVFAIVPTVTEFCIMNLCRQCNCIRCFGKYRSIFGNWICLRYTSGSGTNSCIGRIFSNLESIRIIAHSRLSGKTRWKPDLNWDIYVANDT